MRKVPIKSITIKRVDCTVFNFETKKNHNYFANGILVHNCDSWYTWHRDAKEFYKEPYDINIFEMKNTIRNKQKEVKLQDHCTNICFTGGEPLIQQQKIEKFMRLCPEYSVQIETNGTLMPTDYLLENCIFNCSPKLPNSGNTMGILFNEKVLRAISKTKKPCFKFVCKTAKDIDIVMEKYGFLPKEQIYIMPEGVYLQENISVLQKLIKKIVKLGLCVTPRLQNILYDGAKRGV